MLLLTRHRRPADGLLVGVAAGAGFAALETMGYGFVILIESRGDLGAVDATLLLWGLLSPAGHMAWTGLTATALWYAADPRWRPGAVLRFAAAYLVRPRPLLKIDMVAAITAVALSGRPADPAPTRGDPHPGAGPAGRGRRGPLRAQRHGAVGRDASSR